MDAASHNLRSNETESEDERVHEAYEALYSHFTVSFKWYDPTLTYCVATSIFRDQKLVLCFSWFDTYLLTYLKIKTNSTTQRSSSDLERSSTDLENHLDSEDAGEDEVEPVENSVALRVFVNRVFSSERDAAGADDDHYEQVEVAKIDDEVTKTPQPDKKHTD